MMLRLNRFGGGPVVFFGDLRHRSAVLQAKGYITLHIDKIKADTIGVIDSGKMALAQR